MKKKKHPLDKLIRKNRKIKIEVSRYSEAFRQNMINIAQNTLIPKEGVKFEFSYPKKSVSIDFGYIEVTKERLEEICRELYANKEFYVAEAIFGMCLGNSVIFTDKKENINKYYIAIKDNNNLLQEMLDTSIHFLFRKKEETTVKCSSLKLIGNMAKDKKNDAVLLYFELQQEEGKELFEKIVDKSRIRNKSLQECIKQKIKEAQEQK